MAPRRGAFRGFPSHLANGVEGAETPGSIQSLLYLDFPRKRKAFHREFPIPLSILSSDSYRCVRFQTVLELFSTFDSLASIHNVTASQLPKLWDLLNCMLNRTSLLTLGFRTREFSILLLYYLPLHFEFV